MQKKIGSLTHLAISCRPDIAYAVNRLSRYTNYPNDKIMGWVDKVLAYASRRPMMVSFSTLLTFRDQTSQYSQTPRMLWRIAGYHNWDSLSMGNVDLLCGKATS